MRVLLTKQRGMPRLQHTVRSIKQTLPIAVCRRFFDLLQRTRLSDRERAATRACEALEMGVAAY